MSLLFGTPETTALLELIASGANRAKIYRHFSLEGADQMVRVVDHFPLADVEALKEELDHLSGGEQPSNVLAQQAFIFGALTVMLGYLTEMDPISSVTRGLNEFLADHPILTLSEMADGMDQVIEEARAMGAPEETVALMVLERDQMAAKAAAESD